jgi:hypothetical protein
MSAKIFLFALSSLLLLIAANAAPQPQQADAAVAEGTRNFKYTDFDFPLPGNHGANDAIISTSPVSINTAGIIVGTVHRSGFGCGGDCGNETFVFSGGKFALVRGPVFNGNSTAPVAINNHNGGEILIDQDNQSSQPHYFLYDITQQTFRPISPFIQIGADKVRVEPITGLNDQDEFSGSYNYHGHEYAGFGKLPIGPAGSTAIPTDLGAFAQIACPDNRNARSGGINNKDQVTGYCDYFKGVQSGFLYTNGIVNVFDYPGDQITRGTTLNDAGAVVGVFTLKASGGVIALATSFVWDGSHFSAIAKKPNAHGDLIRARGINNKGEIVGEGAENGSGFTAIPTPANPLVLANAK